MEVLEVFCMSKINSSIFNYPVVLRKVGDELFFSVPDLGYWKGLKINEEINVTPEFKNQISEALIDIWKTIEDHLKNKKWIPDPSQIKHSLQPAENDFTLPEFTKKLNQYMTISENTVRREIQRGALQCYQTEGGHRRIPYSELQKYISNSNQKKIIHESIF